MITRFSKHNLHLKQPSLYIKKFETLCQETTIKSLIGLKTYIIVLIIFLAFGCSDQVEHPDFDSNDLLLVSEINYEWIDGTGKTTIEYDSENRPVHIKFYTTEMFDSELYLSSERVFQYSNGALIKEVSNIFELEELLRTGITEYHYDSMNLLNKIISSSIDHLEQDTVWNATEKSILLDDIGRIQTISTTDFDPKEVFHYIDDNIVQLTTYDSIPIDYNDQKIFQENNSYFEYDSHRKPSISLDSVSFIHFSVIGFGIPGLVQNLSQNNITYINGEQNFKIDYNNSGYPASFSNDVQNAAIVYINISK